MKGLSHGLPCEECPTASTGAGANTNAPSARQSLSEPISQNIADIIELENEDLESTTGTRRWLETASRSMARPAYLVGLATFVGVWILVSLYGTRLGIPRFDPPPFAWLEGLLTLVALLTTTVVLIGQARQSRLAERRAHLDLQINLLTEQKVTQLIHLLEQLRADTPGVRERHDPHTSQLKQPTDAAQLASALKERQTSGGAAEESPSRR